MPTPISVCMKDGELIALSLDGNGIWLQQGLGQVRPPQIYLQQKLIRFQLKTITSIFPVFCFHVKFDFFTLFGHFRVLVLALSCLKILSLVSPQATGQGACVGLADGIFFLSGHFWNITTRAWYLIC